jgi:hypothetical protein
MSANELLALLGLAWSRLAIYPGGLAAFALIWLIARARSGPRDRRQHGTADAAPLASYGALGSAWLGLALLPLPAAASMSRSADLLVVLALLEWPRAVAIAQALHWPAAEAQASGLRRLSAALNSYPALILAALALALPARSFEIGALAQPPAAEAPVSLVLLHWIGASAWALALPAMLGVGPFRADQPTAQLQLGWRDPLVLALQLRAVALVAIGALPWIAPAGALDQPLVYSTGTVAAMIGAPLTLAGALWGYDRACAHQPARRWARAYLVLDLLLLLALLWAAYAQFPRA